MMARLRVAFGLEQGKDGEVQWLKKEVPIWEKTTLTIEEAAEYSNIGHNRLS